MGLWRGPGYAGEETRRSGRKPGLGGYLCLVQGDWSRGFECLAKSSDAQLQELAAKSLAAPAEPAACVELADAWWDALRRPREAPRRSARRGWLLVRSGSGRFDGAGQNPRRETTGRDRRPKRNSHNFGRRKGRDAKRPSVASRRGSEPPVPGAVAAGGHFYKVFLEKISWTDAKAKCEQMSGSLTCIGSSEENEFIINLIETQIGQGVLGTADYKFWLGGHLQNGQWGWISGEPFTFAPTNVVNPDQPCLRHAGASGLARTIVAA